MTTPDPKTGPELLPCPFCGEDAEIEETSCDTLPGVFFMAECPCCPAFIELSDEETVIRAWNRRAPLPALDAVVKALESCEEFLKILNRNDDTQGAGQMVENEVRAALALAKGRKP